MKKVVLDTLLPDTYQSQQRKTVSLLNEYVVGTYNNLGTILLKKINASKKDETLVHDNKNPLKAGITTHKQYIASLHKAESGTQVQLINIETNDRLIRNWEKSDSVPTILFSDDKGVLIFATGKEGGIYRLNYSDFKSGEMKHLFKPSMSFPSPTLSSVKDKKLLIAELTQFELWDLQSGEKLHSSALKKRGNTASYYKLAIKGNSIITLTADSLDIFTIGQPNSVKVLTSQPVIAFTFLGNDRIVTGSLNGSIEIYEIANGKLISALNQVKTSGGTFLQTMKSRVTNIKMLEEFVFAGYEKGNFSVYNSDHVLVRSAAKTFKMHGKVVSLQFVNKKSLNILVSGEKDIIYTWQPDLKKLRSLQPREQPNLDGSLTVRLEGPLKIKKGKKEVERYFKLTGGGIYEFKNPKDKAPKSTYIILSSTAVIPPTTLPRKGLIPPFTIKLSNTKEIVLSVADANPSTQEKWIEAIEQVIKDLSQSYVWHIDYEDVTFPLDDDGKKIQLGSGKTAQVFKAQYNGVNVAVKMYIGHEKGFQNEVEILGAVSHPSVMNFIGACVKPPNLCIVMPYLEQGSLDQILHDSAFKFDKYTWKLFFKVTQDIAEGMNYLHTFTVNQTKKPIMHRDLKPGNVLVNYWDTEKNLVTCKISDFNYSLRNTDSSARVGTINYMAPEVISGLSYDLKADVYSFAMVLYEMVTLTVPFLGKSEKDIKDTIAPGKRLKLPEDLPVPVGQLIQDCWNSESRKRPNFGDIIKKVADLSSSFVVSSNIDDMVTKTKKKQVNSEFQLPKKLYGRKDEVKKVLEVINRVKSGFAELCLIRGRSGLGKSALIKSITTFASTEGFICSGKWNIYAQQTPYFAVIQALRDLLQKKLKTWTEKEIAQWKNKILYSFDDTTVIILESFLPEFSTLIGREVREINLQGMNKEKFNGALLSLLTLLAKKEHPLILALDDLQWADPQSMSLLQQVFTIGEARTGYLLLIGSYRDNEVTPEHPWAQTKAAIEKIGTMITDIEVKELKDEHVQEMLSDMFGVGINDPDIKELAHLTVVKTFGNSFFIHQFLQNLYLSGKIVFKENKWVIDLNAVKELKTTENVKDIISESLADLPKETLKYLYITSCLSSEFSLNLLALLSNLNFSSPQTNGTAGTIPEKLSPGKKELKKIKEALDYARKKNLIELKGKDTYVFAHDQIHYGLYNDLNDHNKALIHYTIGKISLKIMQENATKDFGVDMFDTAQHLNKGLQFIPTQDERYAVAQLSLECSTKAMNSLCSYETAYVYIQSALKLANLTKEPDCPCWKERHDLAWNIFLNLFTAELNVGKGDQLQSTIAVLFANAKTNLEKSVANEKQVLAHHLGFKYADCQQPQLDCLYYLDVIPNIKYADFIKNPDPLLEPLKEEVKQLTKGDLLKALKDREQEEGKVSEKSAAILRVIGLSSVAYPSPIACALYSLLWVKLVLTDKKLELAPFGIHAVSSYAYNYLQDFKLAIELNKFAQELLSGGGNPLDKLRGITLLNVALYAQYMFDSWQNTVITMNNCMNISLRDGDLSTASITQNYIIHLKFLSGENLDGLYTFAKNLGESFIKRGSYVGGLNAVIFSNLISVLQGEPPEILEEKHNLFVGPESKFPASAQLMWLCNRTMIDFYAEQFDIAYTTYEKIVNSPLKNVRNGSWLSAMWRFFGVLLNLHFSLKDPSKREKLLPEAKKLIEEFKQFEQGGKNFIPWIKLLEVARDSTIAQIDGVTEKEEMNILQKIYGAQEAASAAKQPHIAGLISEYGIKYSKYLNNTTMSRAFLFDAVEYYQKWGAYAKVESLRKNQKDLFDGLTSLMPSAAGVFSHGPITIIQLFTLGIQNLYQILAGRHSSRSKSSHSGISKSTSTSSMNKTSPNKTETSKGSTLKTKDTKEKEEDKKKKSSSKTSGKSSSSDKKENKNEKDSEKSITVKVAGSTRSKSRMSSKYDAVEYSFKMLQMLFAIMNPSGPAFYTTGDTLASGATSTLATVALDTDTTSTGSGSGGTVRSVSDVELDAILSEATNVLQYCKSRVDSPGTVKHFIPPNSPTKVGVLSSASFTAVIIVAALAFKNEIPPFRDVYIVPHISPSETGKRDLKIVLQFSDFQPQNIETPIGPLRADVPSTILDCLGPVQRLIFPSGIKYLSDSQHNNTLSVTVIAAQAESSKK